MKTAKEMFDRYIPEIKKFDVDWYFIKDACMQTINKEAGKEPSDEWKKKLLMAEHSPIRRSMISIKWGKIPYCTSVHFCRHHEGIEKFVSTSRTDRTGVDRSERKQTDFVSMQMDMNIQALINLSRKRLCGCADPETRKYMEGLVYAVAEKDPIVAQACVPECIRDGGCPEFYPCGMYDGLKDKLGVASTMQERYGLYNSTPKRKVLLRK